MLCFDTRSRFMYGTINYSSITTIPVAKNNFINKVN